MIEATCTGDLAYIAACLRTLKQPQLDKTADALEWAVRELAVRDRALELAASYRARVERIVYFPCPPTYAADWIETARYQIAQKQRDDQLYEQARAELAREEEADNGTR